MNRRTPAWRKRSMPGTLKGLKATEDIVERGTYHTRRVVVSRARCFGCDQVGHMKRNCPSQTVSSGNDAVFDVGEERRNGRLIDSGATSHMTPHRSDLFDYET